MARFVLGLILLLSLLGSILTHSPAVASPDEVKWSRVNIPTDGIPGNWVLASGSDIQHLTMAIDGTLYAYGKSLTYTLYKSTDGGYSWVYTGEVNDNIVDIATAPDDASIVYYATSSRVYQSTDAGNSFVSLLPNPGESGSNNIEITSIDVARRGSSYIIAVGTRDTDSSQYGGIYTLDESESLSWIDTNLGSYDIYALAFSPNFPVDGQLVAVVTDETDTFVTTKTGNSGWGEIIDDVKLDKDNSGTPTPVAVDTAAAIAFPSDYNATIEDSVLFTAIDAGSGNGDVYRIDRRAAPGSSVATDLDIGSTYGLSNIDVTTLIISGDAATAYLLAGAADSTQSYHSTDGGINWTRSIKPPTGQSKTHVLLAPDFSDSGKAYAATSGTESAFSYTTDSGTTWNQIGLIDTTINKPGGILDLAPSPNHCQDSTLFMLTFGGEHSLWRSLNSGARWERVFTSALAGVDNIERIELSPQYGNGSQVVFMAGDSNGIQAVRKSTDNGQRFIHRSASFSIDTWAVVDDNTLFVGSYDGTNGLVYRTNNSGLFYTTRAVVGTNSLHSIALSPNYEQDETILVGNTNGSVYWSDDNGTSFEPLPPDATSPPLTGSITVALDPQFSNNNTVYAASNTADKGIYRFVIGTSTSWESIDSTLPSGGLVNQLMVPPGGTLYAANSKANGGMERSLNPTYSLGPTFETVTRGLDDGAKLSGVWLSGNQLWSTDTANSMLITLTDSLTLPATLTSPSDQAMGIGTITNHTIINVSLDWETLSGATSYKWQFDYDTDFSAVPAGFEGNTQASSARLPTLEPATTYYWRVRATAPALSPWSAKWSFTTSLDTEAIALKLKTPEAGASEVQLKPIFQWSALAGADSYELLVSTDVHFANPLIIKMDAYALPTTAWQCDINLDYDTTYYWKVRACGTNSYSAWSAVSAFTTEQPPASAPAPEQPPSLELSPVQPSTPEPSPVQPSAPEPSPVQPPAPEPSPAQPPTPELSPVQPPTPELSPVQPLANQATPEWVIWLMYLGGALLLTIVAILITIVILTVKVFRL